MDGRREDIRMEMIGNNSPTKTKWNALLHLLDDESPVVRKAIIGECETHPVEAKEFLESISQGDDPLLARHARELVRALGWIDGVGDFVRFIRSQRYELETGWFLLDRTVYPSFQSSSSTLFMDKVARRSRELLTPPMSSRQSCSVLNRVLFHEYGFRGAGKNFENPENSFLHRVIDRRQGLPITLCVLYILIARRIGLDLEPIGLPGRFMVGCFEDERPFYVDAWAGGKILEVEQMENYLEHSSVENSGSALLPVTVAETLARGCRNLSFHYIQAEDLKRSKMFGSFVDEFERVRRIATNA